MKIENIKANQNHWIETKGQTVEIIDPTDQFPQPHVMVYYQKHGLSWLFYGRIFLDGQFGQFDAGNDCWTDGFEWKDIRAVFLIEHPENIPSLNT